MIADSHTRTAAAEIVLEAVDVRKAFDGVHALRGVSFTLRAGEVHALVGENGAGKSTLIKVLTGAVQPDAGTIFIRGQHIEKNSPAKSRALGIAVIYQQPAVFPHLTVAENIALANESAGMWRKVNWKTRRAQASDLLERTGARISPDALVSSLSMPEQQLVEIAKALDAKASILILDEPTASLGERESENLFRLVKEMRSQGAAIIYISHRFAELFRLADRVTVLRDGSSVETRNMNETTTEQLIGSMAGRDLTISFPCRQVELGETVLEARNVSCKRLGVRNVSLSIRRGEILGLTGLVGSGRTQFAESLFGLSRMDGGEVYIDGSKVSIYSPEEAVRLGFAYVPEDRTRHGVIPDMSVAVNATLANLNRLFPHGFIRFRTEEERAQELSDRLGVKTASVYSLVKTLSGGNQQKVALARALMTNPKILLLDEPTQGIDVRAKSEIYHVIQKLAESGLAILMISSETPEILGMSDRVAVMVRGEIAAIVKTKDATPYSLLELAMGHRNAVMNGRTNEHPFET